MTEVIDSDLGEREEPSQLLRVAAMIAGIGGFAALVQAIVAWSTINAGPVISVGTNGADFRGGQLIMLAGSAVLAIAVAMAMRTTIPAGAIIATLGILIVVVTIINFSSLSQEIDGFAALQSAYMKTTGSTESLGPGLFVSLIGGVLAAFGGMLGSIEARD